MTMTNLILMLGIVGLFGFLIYDQFLMDKLKGDIQLAVPLQRQAKADSWILIGLIALTIYQGVQNHIDPLTIFLLAMAIILAVYTAFWRSPRLLLKTSGFFFGNFYFRYDSIHQINLAEQQILVIDLKNGRRLLVRVQSHEDIEQLVAFFGGYKDKK